METGPRVKFAAQRKLSSGFPGESEDLILLLESLESLGFFPPEPDGRRVGNAAVKTGQGLLVSRSGRSMNRPTLSDLAHVLSFDAQVWKAVYESLESDVEPTSDTPLHWTALIECPKEFGWKKEPRVSLHGHSLLSPKIIQKLSIPVSERETEFSTHEDRDSLRKLLRENPYPSHQVYLRKGHGFFILAQTVSEALEIARQLV